MAIYRLTCMYITDDDEGWSENFYWQGASLSAAQTELNSLIPLLIALRPPSVRMIDAKAADTSIRNNVAFTSLAMPQVGTFTPAAGAGPLEANTALMCEFIAVLPRFMRLFLRGLTSDVISGREKIVNAAWDALFNTLKTALLSGSYQARHQVTPPPHATYSYSPLSSFGSERAGARKPGRPFGLLRGRR